MTEKRLIPAVETRIGTLMEYSRQIQMRAERKIRSNPNPTITISREFGCEAYPVAEQLRAQMEKKTGEPWLLVDRALFDEIARNHNLSEQVMQGLGEKSRFLDEILATFSPQWKTEKDYFRVLCRHIISLAQQGNVIVVGRGSAFITQSLRNCYHFRLFASSRFKIRSIEHRLGISAEEAEKLIALKQSQRDRFIRDFLDRDEHDLTVYNVIFNNDRNTSEKIARTITEYICQAE
ncbi:AAA family ATPase [Pelotalea chapellei]|uniref:Cytidylate kinase family protein n=1 Tax=Pelotalea chapellei TaxID=44671 RepID=A0ABS5U4R0_9BACT|nr:cytidylate kinase-like family protein [Pelotalea chapellei]MBT1070629.1 cytidylate kinase family protein [Pelotalea chapellei]